jgi:hypothetical protein
VVLKYGGIKMVKEIADILRLADKSENWKINLFKLNVTKKEGIKYFVEELSDFDKDGILKTVKEIISLYTDGEKSNAYSSIEDYDSSLISNVVYKMDITNDIIKDACELFISALADPDIETDPTKNKYEGYVLKTSVEKEGEDIPIKLIFMNNPIKVIKNKFFKINGKYKEISGEVLGLKLDIDMISFADKIYFFNNSGEKLFNMERAYKKICQEKVEEIKDIGIVTDIEAFIGVATSGHNPRRFISFNNERIESLKDDKMKSIISKHFRIPLIDGKFDTSNNDTSEKLIKLLCGKGEIDPFNNKPVEVSGAKEWK